MYWLAPKKAPPHLGSNSSVPPFGAGPAGGDEVGITRSVLKATQDSVTVRWTTRSQGVCAGGEWTVPAKRAVHPLTMVTAPAPELSQEPTTQIPSTLPGWVKYLRGAKFKQKCAAARAPLNYSQLQETPPEESSPYASVAGWARLLLASFYPPKASPHQRLSMTLSQPLLAPPSPP